MARPPAFDSSVFEWFDETIITARRLRWTSWGADTTVGRGMLRHCIIEYVPCRSGAGAVTLRRPVSRDCGTWTLRAYTRVRYTLPARRGTTAWLPLPSFCPP